MPKIRKASRRETEAHSAKKYVATDRLLVLDKE
jgi:hypothetical protein